MYFCELIFTTPLVPQIEILCAFKNLNNSTTVTTVIGSLFVYLPYVFWSHEAIIITDTMIVEVVRCNGDDMTHDPLLIINLTRPAPMIFVSVQINCITCSGILINFMWMLRHEWRFQTHSL